ncbi:ORF63 [Ictalurid herpesvirus 1]|nr:ORF63 [Ictalurid herpesvirus 1]
MYVVVSVEPLLAWCVVADARDDAVIKHAIRGWICATVDLQPVTLGAVFFTRIPSVGSRLVENSDFHWIMKLPVDGAQQIDTVDRWIALAGCTGGGEANVPSLLENMLFLGFEPEKTATWSAIYTMESAIYNHLLRKGVDIAFHHIIFRRFCDQLDHLGPVPIDVFERWIPDALLNLEREYGLSIYSLDDKRNFTKFSRPRLGKVLLKRWLADNMIKTNEVSDAELLAICDPDVTPTEPATGAMDLSSLEELIMTLNSRVNIPKAGSFHRVTLRRVTFHQLVKYCLNDDPDDLSVVSLPPRNALPHVPILLMDDSMSHEGIFQYVITDYKSMETVPPGAYSEVFLEGQIVTVLNFDIDRKFSGLLDPMGDIDNICETFVAFLHKAVEKFFNFSQVDKNRIGEVAVFVRRAALPGKFSARFTWFPAYELCFQNIREAADFTGVFQDLLMEEDSFFVYTVTNDGVSTRSCAIDAQPFCRNKSCRLPNSTKMVAGEFRGAFEYIKSYNALVKSNRGYSKMNIGISRSPVAFDRPSLGPQYIFGALARFASAEVTYNSGHASENITVEKDHIDNAYKLLSTIWGDLKISPTTSGSVRLTPWMTKDRFCLVHNRIHHKAGVSVIVTNRRIYPRCFHPDPPAHVIPEGGFLDVIEVAGKPRARVGFCGQ